MKPFDELTPQQQRVRKNAARLVLYGTVALGCLWGVREVVEWQEKDNASVRRIEATMVGYYRETKHRPDTVGMASYMRQRLPPDDYQIWLQEGRRYSKDN